MDCKELIRRLVECDQWDEAIQNDELSLVLEDAADAMEILLAERDAAVEELRGYCRACVYARTNKADYPCSECKHLICGTQEIDGWKWRGPQSAVPESDTK